MFSDRANTLAATLRTVDNWPAALSKFARAKVGLHADDITLHLRDGVSFITPARSESAGPVFEVLAADSYNVGDLAGFLGDISSVVDIGAHIGSAAVAFHRAFPSAHIHCYEPSASSASYLRRNLAANGVSATVNEVAVGGHSGTVALHEDQAASCGTFVDPDGTGPRVPMVSFDELMAALTERPALVKMDCEGSEYEIVAESSPDSWSSVRCLLLEYHPRASQGPEDLTRRLATLGLKPIRSRLVGRRNQGRGEVCYIRSV